jgi:3-dehydroquinate dehydratase-2
VSGVLLVQGANMEYLGHREPEVYGTTTAAELDALLEREARLRGIELEIRYTNVEGEAIDLVYAAVRAGVDGLVMNPAGFLHAGYALRDCLSSVPVPYVEVHMTNIDRRGRRSVTAAAAGMITGLGVDSYVLALDALARVLVREGKGQ